MAAMQVSDLCLFIAFLLASRRMIESTGGVTTLGHLSLGQQVAMGRKILLRVDGFLWSAFLAALTLLLVLRFEKAGDADLVAAFKELWSHAYYLAPAILLVTLIDIGLSMLQGAGRGVVFAFWISDLAPSLVRALTFYAFVFTFAAARLWITLAILIYALRESYRRSPAAPASGATQT